MVGLEGWKEGDRIPTADAEARVVRQSHIDHRSRPLQCQLVVRGFSQPSPGMKTVALSQVDSCRIGD